MSTLTKVNNSKLVIVLSAVILVLLALSLYLASLTGERGRINKKQAYDIAYGKALLLCIVGQRFDCKSMNLYGSRYQSASWFDGIDHWTFSFSARPVDQGEYFNERILLDAQGGSLTERQVLDSAHP